MRLSGGPLLRPKTSGESKMRKSINREEAVSDTIKEAAGTGLATATATAVVGAVGATGLLSLIGVLAAATGTKYLWNAATEPEKTPAATSGKTTPKKEKETKIKTKQ